MASRYVAGETMDEAVRVVRDLMASGGCATFDVLGEFITKESEADETLEQYMELLHRIVEEQLDANVSIKLTGFGLLLDEEACYARVRQLVALATTLKCFVRIDMEDSPVTDRTLAIYRRLRSEGFDRVGVVLQAYLRRTPGDVESLASLRPSYRLCKGIYVEPEAIAYKGRGEIQAQYRTLLEQMLDRGSYVGIATHDPDLVASSRALVAKRGLKRDQYEFQMLLGVAETLRASLISEGHRLRVYVPFGRDWYAYSIRRLKENPSIGRHVLRGLFSRK
ncbi:MAG TPA: proline dehydrogenase family protein [Planctomycetota bacterium]|nr:proline dehydrogenase family protein [Planctomycetota bacterium]